MTGRDRLGDLVDRVRAIETRIDDVSRARLLARIDAGIDALVPSLTPARTGRRGASAWRLATVAAVVAAAIVAVALWSSRSPAPATTQFDFAPGGGPPVAEPSPADEPARSEPAPPSDVLEVPANAVSRVAVSAATQVTAIGPARLRVVDGGASLEVLAGRVVCDHGAGDTRQRLRVVAGSARVIAYRAVFAVDVRDAGTDVRVAVLRGELVVDDDAVAAGRGWRRDGGAARVEPIADDVRELVDHVDAAVAAPAPPTPRPQRIRPRPPAPALAPTVADPASSPGRNAGDRDAGDRDTVDRDTADRDTADRDDGDRDVDDRDGAEAHYRAAELAMRGKERDIARLHLLAIVRDHSSHPLASAALYELALLAHSAGELDGARRYLDQLAARGRPKILDEPAAYLRCRVELAGGDRDAARGCMKGFRRRFPDSPHDAELLAHLAADRDVRDGCAAARPLLTEYLHRYPRGAFAGDAAARLARCE